MQSSVIIRTLNEADRLRLTLASLTMQSVAAEIVVVDDGSTDHTQSVVGDFADRLKLRSIRHAEPKGRSAASNAGAECASGEIAIFLDGDTLAHPELVERHLAVHAQHDLVLSRGETFHLRCTRFLRDPETATPWPAEAGRIGAMNDRERERLKVTRRQIETDFACIERRASPGIYPGAGPRRLYELEIDALRNHPDCEVLWAAASGSNFSVPRSLFLAQGGFEVTMGLNEHRMCAKQLCTAGGRMAFAQGARTYHLTHRVGWRDPLTEEGWEQVFYDRHPTPAVKLLAVLWASIADNSPVPPEARIFSLPDLERRARDGDGIDYDAVRAGIPGLPALHS